VLVFDEKKGKRVGGRVYNHLNRLRRIRLESDTFTILNKDRNCFITC